MGTAITKIQNIGPNKAKNGFSLLSDPQIVMTTNNKSSKQCLEDQQGFIEYKTFKFNTVETA